MNLSNKEILAVKILEILKDSELVKGKEIASQLQISDVYLEQIIMPLRHNGLVETVRGCMGGYKLGNHDANYWHVIDSFSTKHVPEHWQFVFDAIKAKASEMKI